MLINCILYPNNSYNTFLRNGLPMIHEIHASLHFIAYSNILRLTAVMLI